MNGMHDLSVTEHKLPQLHRILSSHVSSVQTHLQLQSFSGYSYWLQSHNQVLLEGPSQSVQTVQRPKP